MINSRWLALLLVLPFSAFAQEPEPIIRYPFNEGTGPAKNTGRGAPKGNLTFGSDAAYSEKSAGVSRTTGDFAYDAQPTNEWGGLAPSEECYAVAKGEDDIHSRLDDLRAFTVTGWINARPKLWTGDDSTGRTLVSFFSSWGNGMSVLLQTGGEIAVKEKDFNIVASSTNDGMYDSTAKKDDPNEETGWVFFAVSWDGKGDKPADRVKFYYGTKTLPAKLVSSRPRGSAAETNTGVAGRLRIGNVEAPGSHWEAFCGQLDDIRIYNIALTDRSIELARTAALRKSR